MKSVLKNELTDILEEIYLKWKQADITLPESHHLYLNAREKYLTSDNEQRTRETSLLILKIFFAVGRINEQFIEEWQNKKFKPKVIELRLLKVGCNEVLAAFSNHFREELLSYYTEQGKQFSTQHEKVKQKVQHVRKLLENVF